MDVRDARSLDPRFRGEGGQMAAPRMTLDSGFRRNDGKEVGTNGMTGGSWDNLNDGREGVGT
jgi:hypothetical protein